MGLIKRNVVGIVYGFLAVASWVVGGALGWLSGDPSTAHVLIILVTSIFLPLLWLGATNLWMILFWERVPVTGSSGLQHTSSSGPLWEYRRKHES